MKKIRSMIDTFIRSLRHTPSPQLEDVKREATVMRQFVQYSRSLSQEAEQIAQLLEEERRRNHFGEAIRLSMGRRAVD